MTRCELCNLLCRLTEHHLVPRSKGGFFGRKAYICRPCHDLIHMKFTNTELKHYFNDLDSLRGTTEVRQWVQFRQAHPEVSSVKEAKRLFPLLLGFI